jgi:uncharacterized GH25 family protein
MQMLQLVRLSRLFAALLSSAVIATLSWNPAAGHELWIEAPSAGEVNQTCKLEVCWGHSGERASGRSLEGQQDKISLQVIQPDGTRSELKPVLATDCFTAEVAPSKPGCYVVGGELQTGIITRQVHSIPPNTRIIMYGKTVTRVGNGEGGFDGVVGHDLEIVLLTPPDKLKPGAVAKAKLLFQGKPLGGRDVELTLSTAGSQAPAEDPQIQSSLWSTAAAPHPKTGEVAFPLIVGGRHFFSVHYVDETAGTYTGDRNDNSDFSHLRKGDAFERTMYMVTLTVQVNED